MNAGDDRSEKAAIDRERISNAHRDVAIVGLRNAQEELFLVKTVRLPSRWQPIGGGVSEDDDSVEDAAIREAREEVGILLSRADLRRVIDVPYDFGSGTITFFEVKLRTSSADISVDEGQIFDHGWFSLQEAAALPVFPATAAFLNALLADG